MKKCHIYITMPPSHHSGSGTLRLPTNGFISRSQCNSIDTCTTFDQYVRYLYGLRANNKKDYETFKSDVQAWIHGQRNIQQHASMSSRALSTITGRPLSDNEMFSALKKAIQQHPPLSSAFHWQGGAKRAPKRAPAKKKKPAAKTAAKPRKPAARKPACLRASALLRATR